MVGKGDVLIGGRGGGNLNLKPGLRLKACLAARYHFLETSLHVLSCSMLKNCRISRKIIGLSKGVSPVTGVTVAKACVCDGLSSPFARGAGDWRPSSCVSLSKS